MTNLMTSSSGLIVIGDGMAGTAVVEEISKRPDAPRITVFGREPHGRYNRILLSDVLACAKSFKEIVQGVPSDTPEGPVQWRPGVPIAAIRPDRKEVVGEDGACHRYDRLIIATGSLPFIPPIRGLDRSGIFSFRTLDDTEAMIRWASGHDRAVVVGGGLLGLEAARGLTNRAMSVTVVHLVDHVMEQQLDARAGAILAAELEKMGIQFRLGCTVEEVTGDARVRGVRLTTGETIETDLVLLTAGIRPNISLARDAGLAVGRGILVDDRMTTSDPDILAVGECIEHRGRTYGLLAPALEQARVAAEAVMGEGSSVYAGSVPSAVLKVAGIRLASMGDFSAKDEGCEELTYMDPAEGIYKKLVIRKGLVAGAIFLGDDGGAGEVRTLMENRRDVSAMRSRLLSGSPGPESSDSLAEAPESTLICNCHGVTKGEILCAFREKGCVSREQVSEVTRAGTGCGSCVPRIEELLETAPRGEGASPTAARSPRTSTNKIEIWKQEKDGLDVLDDLDRYAIEGWETISESDVQRLKWHGLFLRVPTPGLFMIRVRMPGGIARSAQFRALAEISDRFGKGFADITTRQQIQLRNMRIEEVPEIFRMLASVGLGTLQTGMDSIRNIIGCPVTGLTPAELHDTSPIIRAFNETIVGNREFTNLPRKFNVAVTGCRENCLHADTQDVALVPATRQIDGEAETGFNLLAGGKVGSGGFRAASPLDVFVRPDEAVEVLCHITRLFRDHGPRESRTRSRLAFLVDDWGVSRIRKELETRMGRPLSRAGKDERDPRKRADHVGLFRQRQPGLNYVGLKVPVGRLTSGQMAEAARLADEYGNGELRLTHGQNLILPHIPDARIGKMAAEEPLLKDLRYDPSEVMRGLVSCTGIEYCGLAVIETKNRALETARRLEREISEVRPLSIHWSGCPAGCGNHLIADIGLLGKRAKVDRGDGSKEVVDAVDIFIGGRGGPRPRSGTKVFEDVPCEQLPEILKSLASHAVREKGVEIPKDRAPSISSWAGNAEIHLPSPGEEPRVALKGEGSSAEWGNQ